MNISWQDLCLFWSKMKKVRRKTNKQRWRHKWIERKPEKLLQSNKTVLPRKMKKVRIERLLPKKYPNPNHVWILCFDFSPIVDQEELCGDKQRAYHCKNGRKTSPPVRTHQLPTSRAPLPRTYHQGNPRAPGCLPGVPRHTEPRMYRVPSLQRHWAGGAHASIVFRRQSHDASVMWDQESLRNQESNGLHSHSSWKHVLLFCVGELASLVSSWIIQKVRSDIWPYTGRIWRNWH